MVVRLSGRRNRERQGGGALIPTLALVTVCSFLFKEAAPRELTGGRAHLGCLFAFLSSDYQAQGFLGPCDNVGIPKMSFQVDSCR